MDLTYPEALAIEGTRKMTGLWRKGVVIEDEVIRSVVFKLLEAGDGAERIVPFSLAALPAELRPGLRAFVREPAAFDPRNLFFFCGGDPSEEEWGHLRRRCRVICEAIERVLREAEDGAATLDRAAELKVDVFWALLRGLPTSSHRPCRAESCSAPSIQPSVFCARHHYEELQGHPPRRMNRVTTEA